MQQLGHMRWFYNAERVFLGMLQTKRYKIILQWSNWVHCTGEKNICEKVFEYVLQKNAKYKMSRLIQRVTRKFSSEYIYFRFLSLNSFYNTC